MAARMKRRRRSCLVKEWAGILTEYGAPLPQSNRISLRLPANDVGKALCLGYNAVMSGRLLLLSCLFFLSLPSPALETQFGGNFAYEVFHSPAELPEPTRTTDHILHLTPELDLKFNKRSRMHFKPTLRANVSTEEKPENLFLNVQEAYWEIKTHPIRLKIGQNTYNWGVLDGYSTMDVVNGRTMFNPLATDKRGAPTVDIQYEGDKFQIQALYIPAQARTLPPSADSRWLPRNVIISDTKVKSFTFLVPTSDFNYYYSGYEELDHALDHNFGLRLTGRWGDFDLALMGFEGNTTSPQFLLNVTGTTVVATPGAEVIQVTSDIGLRPVYYRQRAAGLSVVWAPEDFIIKFESTYVDSITETNYIAPWYWQNGLGIEKPFNIGSTSLTFIVQGYYGDNEDPVDNILTSTTRLFDQAALAGLRASFTPETNLLMSYFHDIANDGAYAHLAVDHKFSESLKAELSGDLLTGDPGSSVIGTYDKNDRVVFKLSYLW